MLRNDLVLGFVIAGLLAAAVPTTVWQHVYVTADVGAWRTIENALVGPLIAVLSFVCSIGNVPLAAVLWSGGSTFGGVISFLYADLIVLPLIDVYRKYYGWGLALRMAGVFYLAMVCAGLLVELAFSAFGAVPRSTGNFLMQMETIRLNYTTVLNIAFITAAIALVSYGRRDGGREHHAHCH